MEGGGTVTCGSWIKRPENVNLVVLGKSSRASSSPSVLEIFSFDPKTTSVYTSPLVKIFFFEKKKGKRFRFELIFDVSLTFLMWVCFVFGFFFLKVTYVFDESEGDPMTIAVNPSGDDFVCSTTNGGCK